MEFLDQEKNRQYEFTHSIGLSINRCRDARNNAQSEERAKYFQEQIDQMEAVSNETLSDQEGYVRPQVS